MSFLNSAPGALRQAPAGSAKIVSGLRIAKAFRSYPKWKRARDAADWVRGAVTITPTMKQAASIFGVAPPLVKAQLEHRARGKHHVGGNGRAAALPDAVVDRIVAAIGADRVSAALDRATQPELPLQAAE